MDATLKALLACLFYGFISTSITFFNKAVLASFKFAWPNLMTLFQMLCSLLFLETMKLFKIINYASPSWETSNKVSPLSFAFVGMVLTGLGALKYLNIPMFNSLRRVTTLFTMFGEAYLVGKGESRTVKLSVYLMVLGAVVASIWDFDFSLIGYVLVALNCVFTAAYLLYIAKFGKAGLDTFGMMWYNNVQSLPVVFLICWVNGDFAEVMDYQYLYDPSFLICFFFQSGLAFLLNYSIFLCTNINSALATSVTGQIKNIATTLVGYFSFGDVTYNILNVFGLILGVIGSTLYSWLKYEESEASKKKSTILPMTQPAKEAPSVNLEQENLIDEPKDPKHQ